MKTGLKVFGAVLGLLLLGLVVRSWQVSQPLYEETLAEAPMEAFTLAAPERALSLARTVEGQPLLVTAMDRSGVDAVDLGAVSGLGAVEPLAVYRALGEERLLELLAMPAAAYPWAALGVPFNSGAEAIAAGTNFRAHAEETGLEDGPFLFPKRSLPTPWQAPVAERMRLDYEVELCAVTIEPVALGQAGQFAYCLCNDFTDRWVLLRGIDLDQPLGRTGFPAGKGGPGLFPTGAILLAPRSTGFYRQLDLGLTVNGRLRQRGSASAMIWPAERVAQEALALGDTPFYLPAGTVPLTTGSVLPSGTALLLGTPAGVALQLPNIWMANAFLQEGDQVLAYGTHLGVLANTITAPNP